VYSPSFREQSGLQEKCIQLPNAAIKKITVWIYQQNKIITLPESKLDEPIGLPTQTLG
jgi:hypothetical protein